MDITIEEFFKDGDPILYSKQGINIYYSHINKYHWYCVVNYEEENHLLKIDFEFGDMDEFTEKIKMKLHI